MREAYICDYIRTPIGRFGGSLASVRADDLGAIALKALMDRNRSVDWEAVDDVIFGCANQAGEDNRNVARMSLLLAGLPVAVPGTTINPALRMPHGCPVLAAARAIKCGEAELMIAGGVESMSRAPFVLPKARERLFAQCEIPRHDDRLALRQSADEGTIWGRLNAGDRRRTSPKTIRSRARTRRFRLRSQANGRAAQPSGRLASEIVAVTIPQRKGEPPSSSTATSIRAPRRSRRSPSSRLPSGGRHRHRGNASGVNDGAGALIIASEEAARKYGLRPWPASSAALRQACRRASWAWDRCPPSQRLMTRLADAGSVRRHRTQRGFCQPGTCGPRALESPTTIPRQPQRRRHRTRPSARMSGAAITGTAALELAGNEWPHRACHHVHRGRPGHRGGRWSGVSYRVMRNPAGASTEEVSSLATSATEAAGRPFPEMIQHSAHGAVRPGDEGGHQPSALVANPAVKAEPFRLLACPVAKAHALYPSGNSDQSGRCGPSSWRWPPFRFESGAYGG